MQEESNLFLSIFKQSGFKQLSLLNICDRCTTEADMNIPEVMRLFRAAMDNGDLGFDSKNQIVYLKQQF